MRSLEVKETGLTIALPVFAISVAVSFELMSTLSDSLSLDIAGLTSMSLQCPRCAAYNSVFSLYLTLNHFQ